ncbi:MAG: dihydroorotase, partial [Nitrosopumilaceae archaeon]|nr:dihydroorotase [Nitrosopumilaceae archaeon]
MTADCVIVDAKAITPKGMIERNIVINEGKISDFTTDVPSCDKKVQGKGLVAIPGLIDTHVHYGVYSPIE